MKLYSSAYSYNSRRCRAVITHLGLDVDIEEVDLGAGAHHQADFKAMNPNAKVPVLVDGDLVLWESLAILSYLSDVAGGALKGSNAKEAADILRWSVWTVSRFNAASSVYLFENMVKPFFGLGEADADKLAQTAPEIEACYGILEAQLNAHDYLSSAGLSLADFALYPTFEHAGYIQLPDWSAYPNLSAWVNRMKELPAFSAP